MLPPILNTPPISHPFHLSRLSPCPTLYESQSTGFKLPVSYSNSHWLFILNMVMYMFQHYAFNSSLPLVPPLCPQVCSLRLHLHSCPSNSFIKCIAILLPSPLYKKRAKLVPYERYPLCAFGSLFAQPGDITRNVCLGNAKKLAESGIASTTGSEM